MNAIQIRTFASEALGVTYVVQTNTGGKGERELGYVSRMGQAFMAYSMGGRALKLYSLESQAVASFKYSR